MLRVVVRFPPLSFMFLYVVVDIDVEVLVVVTVVVLVVVLVQRSRAPGRALHPPFVANIRLIT